MVKQQDVTSCQISHNNRIVFKICDALPDVVLFVQFKKREKHPWRSVTTKNNTSPW